jgi:hypothetical protein
MIDVFVGNRDSLGALVEGSRLSSLLEVLGDSSELERSVGRSREVWREVVGWRGLHCCNFSCFSLGCCGWFCEKL